MKLHNVDIPEHYMSMMYRQCCQNCRKDSDPWKCEAMKIVLVWRGATTLNSFYRNTEWFCEGHEPENEEKSKSP